MLQDILPLLLTLAGIVLVLYLSHVFSKYVSSRTVRMNGAKYMDIVDRMAVGQDRFLLIVKIQEKYYLVGTTGQSIQLLKELDDAVPLTPIEPQAGGGVDMTSFKNVLQNFMPKKK